MRLLAIVTGCLAIAGCDGGARSMEELRADEAVVESVTDGDTIRVRGGDRVRLVQIDAPETNNGRECGGDAATAALRRELEVGTRVRLEREPESDDADRYGRLLRYVYVGDRNLNLWMVREGHAAPYFFDGERGRHADELLDDARRARRERRGFWGRCPRAVLNPQAGVDTGALAADASNR